MTGPEGNSEFCFPRRSRGKHWDLICYIAKQNKSKFWKTRWDSSDNIRPPLWHATAVNISRLTENCFPFDAIGSGKRGHIVADTLLPMMFLGLRKLGNICCGHKMFLTTIRNIFCVPVTKIVSATNVARAGKRGTFLPATMCPQQCVLVARAYSFRNVSRPWHLAGNSFVRCHMTMNWSMNGRAVAGKTSAI